MSESEDIDLELEKTQSFEMGQISQLESIASELRKRAGEIYAYSDDRTKIEKANQLKSLASEFECKARQKRKTWDEEYRPNGEVDERGLM